MRVYELPPPVCQYGDDLCKEQFDLLQDWAGIWRGTLVPVVCFVCRKHDIRTCLLLPLTQVVYRLLDIGTYLAHSGAHPALILLDGMRAIWHDMSVKPPDLGDCMFPPEGNNALLPLRDHTSVPLARRTLNNRFRDVDCALRVRLGSLHVWGDRWVRQDILDGR